MEDRGKGENAAGSPGAQALAALLDPQSSILDPRPPPHRIVIVGGGAGGLELATRLGNTLGKRKLAHVQLVDRLDTHVWKPLLHEVAAGSLDINAHQLDYLAQARWHHFAFRPGALLGLDRARREITVSAVHDDEGLEILPQRALPYDTLVIAIGCLTNTFNTPGVADHAICLDSAPEAERFHRKLVAACVRADGRIAAGPGAGRSRINVAIIGAGATGVELAAELRNTTELLASYGLDHLDPARDVSLTVIEAGPRILAPLAERVSKATHELLEKMSVTVFVNERVTEVTADAVITQSGKRIASDLTVWSAGVRAADVLATLDGLEVNRANQLVVRQTLQATLDDNVFAFGDCAACPWPEKKSQVPPRNAAAHQQASLLAKSLRRRLQGKRLAEFHYRDFGSLVSLGEASAVGNLMGALIGGSLFIEGLIAWWTYISLYKLHQIALHGLFNVTMDTIANLIRRTTPRVKLH